MKMIVTIEAVKSKNDAYTYTARQKPEKHEIYLAIQEYLGANGYDVEALVVEDDNGN